MILDHTHELRVLRNEIEHLLRGRSVGTRFTSNDEARYRYLCGRELELLRAIKGRGVPVRSTRS